LRNTADQTDALLVVCAADLDKVVAKTDGYSGSDMRHLIQEACQGPVRCAAAKLKEGIAKLNPDDLRPVSGFAAEIRDADRMGNLL
jgi:SpoVK/Ycf46/Vps4 family AAA+-type ATPase